MFPVCDLNSILMRSLSFDVKQLFFSGLNVVTITIYSEKILLNKSLSDEKLCKFAES